MDKQGSEVEIIHKKIRREKRFLKNEEHLMKLKELHDMAQSSMTKIAEELGGHEYADSK